MDCEGRGCPFPLRSDATCAAVVFEIMTQRTFCPFPALPGLHLVQTAQKHGRRDEAFPGEGASDGAVAWDTPRAVHGEATSPRELYRGDSVELIARAW